MGKYRHSEDVRRRVGELVELGYGPSAISEELSISRHTVKRWVSLYRRLGPEGLTARTTRTNYGYATKLAAVNKYLEGATSDSVLREYGIRHPGQLDKWVREYRESGPEALSSRHGISNPERLESIEHWAKRLEMENAALKKLLALVSERQRSARR